MALPTKIIFVMIIFATSGHSYEMEFLQSLDKNSVEEENGHSFYQPSEWGGKSLPQRKSLDLPVDLVIIAHTVTPFCHRFLECSRQVVAMQKYHLTLGFTDLSYNFVIGGDGNIYIGRGWDNVNPLRRDSISISFIGNYLYDELTESMVDALDELLEEGVKFKALKMDYKIVAHNQTKATFSPGENVYKVIKNWPHFQNGTF